MIEWPVVVLYRIFVDETGCAQAKPPTNERSRYLSLTGVIVSVDTLRQVIEPNFNALRAEHFGSQAVLHRREIVNFSGPFACLKEQERRDAWERALLQFLAQSPFWVITVCLDKAEFHRKWPRSEEDPYHLCMVNLLERYFYFLRKYQARGDVIVEGRNRPENERLKEAFATFHAEGGRFIRARYIQRRIEPGLKILPRSENVTGLQIADLIAMPSFYVCRFFQTNDQSVFHGEMVRKIGRLLEREKYYRSTGGRKDGFGRVWKP